MIFNFLFCIPVILVFVLSCLFVKWCVRHEKKKRLTDVLGYKCTEKKVCCQLATLFLRTKRLRSNEID